MLPLLSQALRRKAYKSLVVRKKSSTFALANEGTSLFSGKYRGVEQLVARQAHNLEVACSSPASATIKPVI